MDTSLSIKGLLNLFVVYLAWGSTYLFIRVAVREGSGFPPFAMVASRTLCASLILFLIAGLFRKRLRPSRRELGLLAVSGIMLWLGGNGMVTWAERHVNSGYAALIIGTAPIFAVVLESVLDRELPSPLVVFSLLVAFTGLGVLIWPVLQQGVEADAASTLALLTAAVLWPAGSLLVQRSRTQCSPVVISAYQQFFGGLSVTAAMLVTSEPRPQPNASAWVGWAYLIVVGSLISFTSYLVAVRSLPIKVVMTYAYVNPVIAVVLGWLVLQEQITATTLFGMALILAGVAGVFRQRLGRRNL